MNKTNKGSGEIPPFVALPEANSFRAQSTNNQDIPYCRGIKKAHHNNNILNMRLYIFNY